MGAKKKSFRRMNSACAPNSQPRIPTRVCQGRVVTTDPPTLGTNPNSKQHGSGTQEAKDLDRSAGSTRTVRTASADSPQAPSGRSATLGRTVRKRQQNLQYRTPEIRTVRPWPPDSLMMTDSPWTPREQSGPHADCPVPLDGRSDEPLATKPQSLGRTTLELARPR
jgi:hypothetical protein